MEESFENSESSVMNTKKLPSYNELKKQRDELIKVVKDVAEQMHWKADWPRYAKMLKAVAAKVEKDG